MRQGEFGREAFRKEASYQEIPVKTRHLPHIGLGIGSEKKPTARNTAKSLSSEGSGEKATAYWLTAMHPTKGPPEDPSTLLGGALRSVGF